VNNHSCSRCFDSGQYTVVTPEAPPRTDHLDHAHSALPYDSHCYTSTSCHLALLHSDLHKHTYTDCHS